MESLGEAYQGYAFDVVGYMPQKSQRESRSR